jgi:hypothetical protein
LRDLRPTRRPTTSSPASGRFRRPAPAAAHRHYRSAARTSPVDSGRGGDGCSGAVSEVRRGLSTRDNGRRRSRKNCLEQGRGTSGRRVALAVKRDITGCLLGHANPALVAMAMEWKKTKTPTLVHLGLLETAINAYFYDAEKSCYSMAIPIWATRRTGCASSSSRPDRAWRPEYSDDAHHSAPKRGAAVANAGREFRA